jgi:catechol 2,3-dioxygenase
LFLSAGGYHHHLGVNVWAGVGAPSPPPDAVGLVSFALTLPDREAWLALKARIESADVEAEEQDYQYAIGFLVHDADRNGVELLVEHPVQE